jgi:glutaredoxin
MPRTTPTPAPRHLPGSRILLCLSLGLGLPMAALAQYKVVGPDGKVTYTDRPPVQAGGRVGAAPTGAGGAGATGTALAALPFDLRQAATRYPVTLYATASCDGCDAGRQFLRARGIPYSEKTVSQGDGEALQQATGGREVPSLTIGSQVVRGFSPDNWASYLDAAGYPSSSKLPPSYVAPAPTPLVPARALPTPAPAPAPRPEQPPAAPPPAQGGIRF